MRFLEQMAGVLQVRRAMRSWIRASVLAAPLALFALLPEVAVAIAIADTVDRSRETSPYAASLTDEEVLRYGWGLGGFKGTLVRLILPGRGDAVLRTGRNGTGHLVSELNISSPRSRHGDFQRYGAEIGSHAGAPETRKAWTTQMFRGKNREKEADLVGQDAVDIASCIWRLRSDPSFGAGEARLWSSGKFYPIEISVAGRGWGTLDGERVGTKSFLIRGIRRPDERFWKGRVELVLAEDKDSTPLEIVLRQEGVKVRLALLQR